MEVFESLHAREILAPVIIGLAVFGYVRCFAGAFWLTLVVSAALAAAISVGFPFTAENAVVWGGAGLFVLLAMALSRLGPRAVAASPQPGQVETPEKDQRAIVIDGTNVMYWDGEEADLTTLRSVVNALKKSKYAPHVFLDASSRHHLGDKSLTEKGFAKALGLPRNRVFVCPAGTEADSFLLKYAKENDAPVVSNDQFRDRAQIAKNLRLVRGIFAGGKPILEGL